MIPFPFLESVSGIGVEIELVGPVLPTLLDQMWEKIIFGHTHIFININV
jgi:hypothetical protein